MREVVKKVNYKRYLAKLKKKSSERAGAEEKCTFPSAAALAKSSPSLVKARAWIAPSCAINRSSSTTAWYGKSRRSLQVNGSHT